MEKLNKKPKIFDHMDKGLVALFCSGIITIIGVTANSIKSPIGDLISKYCMILATIGMIISVYFIFKLPKFKTILKRIETRRLKALGIGKYNKNLYPRNDLDLINAKRILQSKKPKKEELQKIISKFGPNSAIGNRALDEYSKKFCKKN